MSKEIYMKWTKDRLAERVVDLIKQRDGAIDEANLREGERDLLLKDKNELDRMYVSVTTRNTELEQELALVKDYLNAAQRRAQHFEEMGRKARAERDRARQAVEHQALGLGRLTEHMEPRELVSVTAMNTEG